VSEPPLHTGDDSYQYHAPPHMGLDILYSDADFLLLNKPSGLLSVPGRGEDRQDSMSSRLQAEYPEALVVHRLDMSTSGIMLFARHKAAHRAMSMLFAERAVSKTYVAVVDGLVKDECGEINQPLITDWHNRPRQKIDHEHGKPSTTAYKVLQRDVQKKLTRVQLHPITGRSHQLRLHMQWLGHAILGDEFYACETARLKSNRLLLHAQTLAFKQPMTNKSLQITCFADF